MRLLIYGFGAWLGLWVIFPALGGGALGMLLAAPTAALAIATDLMLSAWALGEKPEQVAVRRMLRVDRILSREQRQLPPGKESSKKLPPR